MVRARMQPLDRSPQPRHPSQPFHERRADGECDKRHQSRERDAPPPVRDEQKRSHQQRVQGVESEGGAAGSSEPSRCSCQGFAEGGSRLAGRQHEGALALAEHLVNTLRRMVRGAAGEED